MGDEISAASFELSAYAEFKSRLEKETSILNGWIESNSLNDPRAFGGFEQEAWLVDKNFNPAPLNEQFIAIAKSDLVSAELARFNIELNVNPVELHGNCLNRFNQELNQNWNECSRVASQLGARLVMIGILPTVKDADLTLQNMSSLNRYMALNEQVMLARKGVPMQLEISGTEHLKSTHYDVMLESAATSYQIHRQIPAELAPRYFNSAIILSAVTVAVGANSPYLFGRQLWEETRIPLFEQAVEIGGLGSAKHGPIRRVTFGSGYIRKNIFECFRENLDHYPVLLPVALEGSERSIPHLRLHNGTIWRWNRPLIGFDANGVAHVRIEHRVIAAGPTIIDEIANTAFFLGLQEWMATHAEPMENRIEHAQAKYNFYEGARLGLDANIHWGGENKIQISKLILDQLLEHARMGLQQLEVDRSDIEDYLDVINARVSTQQTGARWQKSFVKRHGADMRTMLEAYYTNQQSGNPVHAWQA